jgi:hypothetical protein
LPLQTVTAYVSQSFDQGPQPDHLDPPFSGLSPVHSIPVSVNLGAAWIRFELGVMPNDRPQSPEDLIVSPALAPSLEDGTGLTLLAFIPSMADQTQNFPSKEWSRLESSN